MSITSLSSWVYFSIQLLWGLHTIFAYFQAFNNVYTYDNIILTIYGFLIDYNQVGLIITSILLAFIYISIFFPKTKKDSGVLFILEYIGSQLYPYLRYLIEIELYVVGFFMFAADIGHIIVFTFAALAAFISVILLQNITLRKGEFCCKSI